MGQYSQKEVRTNAEHILVQNRVLSGENPSEKGEEAELPVSCEDWSFLILSTDINRSLRLYICALQG